MTVSVCSSESFNRPTGPEGTGVAETSDSPLARFFSEWQKHSEFFIPAQKWLNLGQVGRAAPAPAWDSNRDTLIVVVIGAGVEVNQVNKEERKSKYLKIHSSKRSEGKIHWYLYYRILVLAWQHDGNCGCLLRVRYLLPTGFSSQEPPVIEKFFLSRSLIAELVFRFSTGMENSA